MNLKTQKIVITGGPGTGKTVIIDRLESNGYHCFPEVIRLMTLEAKKNGTMEKINSNPISSVSDPMDFNLKILKGRTNQYKEALRLQKNTIFFDRGIPDVLAYMDFFKQEYSTSFLDTCKKHEYSHVFVLPPWKDIYVQDNERFESFEEAEQLYVHLKETYTNLGYTPIIVPADTIENRTSFIINHLEKE